MIAWPVVLFLVAVAVLATWAVMDRRRAEERRRWIEASTRVLEFSAPDGVGITSLYQPHHPRVAVVNTSRRRSGAAPKRAAWSRRRCSSGPIGSRRCKCKRCSMAPTSIRPRLRRAGDGSSREAHAHGFSAPRRPQLEALWISHRQ